MNSMTLEQLRAASNAGGVDDVVLKGEGGAFLVQIHTRSGPTSLLARARSTEPRRFGNPISAFNVLREIGIFNGRFDASGWNPEEKESTAGNRGRGDAMRAAHQAAAYSTMLAADILEAVADTRPNIEHDQVMQRMDARITDHQKSAGKSISEKAE